MTNATRHGRAGWTTGWCLFAANLVGQITERVAALPGMAGSTVEVVWDEPWTTDRLSDKARHPALLPHPKEVGLVIGNDAIVFDGVAHVFNFEKKNALGPGRCSSTTSTPSTTS